MSEEKVYPVPAAIAAKAHINADQYATMYATLGRGPRRVLGRAGRAVRHLVQALGLGARLELRRR